MLVLGAALYGVAPLDSAVVAGVACMLFAVTFATNYILATRIDPDARCIRNKPYRLFSTFGGRPFRRWSAARQGKVPLQQLSSGTYSVHDAS